MNFRDAENLSTYLDGELNPAEASRLERRIESDENLRRIMEDLRLARKLVRQVRPRRAARNFTLTPLMPRLRAPVPRAVPVLRLASVLASLLFLATFALNGLAPLAARELLSASPPVSGVGGGAAADSQITEAPLESLAAEAPVSTPGPEQALAAQEPATPVAELLAPAAPQEMGKDIERRATEHTSIPAQWQFLLGIAAVLFGGIAWYLQRYSWKNFRSRWLEK